MRQPRLRYDWRNAARGSKGLRAAVRLGRIDTVPFDGFVADGSLSRRFQARLSAHRLHAMLYPEHST